MEIRPATKKDLPRLESLYRQLFESSAVLQPKRFRPAKIDLRFMNSVIRQNTGDILLAEDKETVLGFALVLQRDTPPFACLIPCSYAYLMDICVEKSVRGEKIGTQLLNAVKQWADERNLQYIELDVLEQNQSAQKFYQTNGFSGAVRTLQFDLRSK